MDTYLLKDGELSARS